MEINEIKQEETLKIEKNSKGYNWEFRLLGKVEDIIERSMIITAKLQRIYGQKSDELNLKEVKK